MSCGLWVLLLIAWGLLESRKERVNLGVAGFALTVLAFYFSSVMDKLDRAASLITLGFAFVWGVASRKDAAAAVAESNRERIMKPLYKGLIIALVHVCIVSSLGAKLLYDRTARPRVWALTTPYDPDLPSSRPVCAPCSLWSNLAVLGSG